MKRQQGFTVIELVFVIVFAGLATGLLLFQKAETEAAQRDNDRKTAINAMYYNLEEVFFEKNGYYPLSIDTKNLTAMDPELFKDPSGNTIGEAGSDYRYESIDCQAERCKEFSLRANLEKEADFIKSSRDK